MSRWYRQNCLYRARSRQWAPQGLRGGSERRTTGPMVLSWGMVGRLKWLAQNDGLLSKSGSLASLGTLAWFGSNSLPEAENARSALFCQAEKRLVKPLILLDFPP